MELYYKATADALVIFIQFLSEVLPKWKMIEMLDNWDRLTGKKPAYKIDEQSKETSKISIKR